jgi:hypothetical protein
MIPESAVVDKTNQRKSSFPHATEDNKFQTRFNENLSVISNYPLTLVERACTAQPRARRRSPSLNPTLSYLKSKTKMNISNFTPSNQNIISFFEWITGCNICLCVTFGASCLIAGPRYILLVWNAPSDESGRLDACWAFRWPSSKQYVYRLLSS